MAFREPEAVQFARKVEQLGYSVLWVPEVMGREIFTLSSHLLGQTERLIVGTGVAIAYAYEPIAVAAATRTLGEFFEDRFILGLGVSNKAYNAKRGIPYEKPVAFMQDYLERMKSAPYVAPSATTSTAICPGRHDAQNAATLSHSNPRNADLFHDDRASETTREALGPKPWLCAVQLVISETDVAKARATARRYMATYMAIEHYLYRLRRLGFTDADFANGCSDRLVDAIVAWGSEDKIRQRIADQIKAGATHVSILPIDPNGGRVPDARALEAFAPGTA